MKLSNTAYDVLNFIVRALLPLADLIMTLVTIWGLPYGQEISATIIAIHAFLAIFVTGANAAYKNAEAEQALSQKAKVEDTSKE